MQGRVHIWDSGNIIADIGTETVYYIRVLTLIYAKKGETKTYYRFNGHGDVIALANSNGAIIKRYKYDSFGVEENPGIFDTNVFRYCGEYYDIETKTIYLRARYYDAETGRFTQQDGWSYAVPGFLLSLNLYTYCGNDPVSYIDPSGHSAKVGFFKGCWGAVKGAFKGYMKARVRGGDNYALYMLSGAISGFVDNFISNLASTPVFKRVFSIIGAALSSSIDKFFEQIIEGQKIDFGEIVNSGIEGAIKEVVSYIINETIAQNVAKGIKEIRAWMADVFEQYSVDPEIINKVIDTATEKLISEAPVEFAAHFLKD